MFNAFGINISSEETAEGWFGSGMKSAIWSVVFLTISVVSILIFGILFAMNVFGETSIAISQPNAPITQPAPAQPDPIVQIPAASEPASTKTPTTTTEPGVIVLTVEELLNQIIQNPDKYKKGTVMQLTGVAFPPPMGSNVYNLYLGPKVQGGWYVSVNVDIAGDLAAYLIRNYGKLKEGLPITIQGAFYYVGEKYITLDNGILVK